MSRDGDRGRPPADWRSAKTTLLTATLTAAAVPLGAAVATAYGPLGWLAFLVVVLVIGWGVARLLLPARLPRTSANAPPLGSFALLLVGPLAYLAYAAMVGGAAAIVPETTAAILNATVGRLDALVPVAAEAEAWFAARHGPAVGRILRHLAAAHALFALVGFGVIAWSILSGRQQPMVQRSSAISPLVMVPMVLPILALLGWTWLRLYVTGRGDGPFAFGANLRDPRLSALAFAPLAAIFTAAAGLMSASLLSWLAGRLRGEPEARA